MFEGAYKGTGLAYNGIRNKITSLIEKGQAGKAVTQEEVANVIADNITENDIKNIAKSAKISKAKSSIDFFQKSKQNDTKTLQNEKNAINVIDNVPNKVYNVGSREGVSPVPSGRGGIAELPGSKSGYNGILSGNGSSLPSLLEKGKNSSLVLRKESPLSFFLNVKNPYERILENRKIARISKATGINELEVKRINNILANNSDKYKDILVRDYKSLIERKAGVPSNVPQNKILSLKDYNLPIGDKVDNVLPEIPHNPFFEKPPIESKFNENNLNFDKAVNEVEKRANELDRKSVV